MSVASHDVRDALLVWHGAVLSSGCAVDASRERCHNGLYITIVPLIVSDILHMEHYAGVCDNNSSQLTFFRFYLFYVKQE